MEEDYRNTFDRQQDRLNEESKERVSKGEEKRALRKAQKDARKAERLQLGSATSASERREIKERFENIQETARYCGPVPSGMIRRPYKNRVMVLGDAAGMAKPTTGGGLGPGFKQISSIVDKLVVAINNNKLTEKDLKSITKHSWPKMKKEQDRARALRDLLVSTRTDEELDQHFANFAKPEIIALINSIGDIEKPVPLGMALLRKVPAFRKLAFQAGIKLLFT